MTALTVVERAAVVLQSDKAAAELAALAQSTVGITTITNNAGRAECHSAAMRAADARIAIEKTGKDARDDATKFSKAVIAEEKRLVAIIEPEEKRLKAIRDEWDAKVEAEKEAKRRAEAERISGIQRRIDAIKEVPMSVQFDTLESMRNAVSWLASVEIDESFAELRFAAEDARGASIDRLRIMVESKEKAEEEEAKRRAEKEESDRLAAEERARIDAEKAALAEARRKLDAEKAEQDRLMAEQRAREKAEADRIKAEEDARMAEERAQLAKMRAEFEAKQQAEAEKERKAADDRKLAEELRVRLAAINSLVPPTAQQIISMVAEYFAISDTDTAIRWMADPNLHEEFINFARSS